MTAYIFASGSRGNCLLLSGSGTNILIDAGISMCRLEESLRQAGLTVRDIGGVLITHEHSDHISGLKTLIKRYDIPIYAPNLVAAKLWARFPDIDNSLKIIEPGFSFNIGAMLIRAFHTPHDTDESVGYRVECGGVFAIATDMGHVTKEVEENLMGADAVLVESNHDLDMLSYGAYPVYLKRRILSDRGHLSNENCAQLVKKLADSGVKKIVLGHLSRDNNTPEKALSASQCALGDMNVGLCCAPDQGFLSFTIGDF